MNISDMTKVDVRASEVRAGDWTAFNGHRLVVDNRALSRGRRRGLVRVNGRMDKMPQERVVTIYREGTYFQVVTAPAIEGHRGSALEICAYLRTAESDGAFDLEEES